MTIFWVMIFWPKNGKVNQNSEILSVWNHRLNQSFFFSVHILIFYLMNIPKVGIFWSFLDSFIGLLKVTLLKILKKMFQSSFMIYKKVRKIIFIFTKNAKNRQNHDIFEVAVIEVKRFFRFVFLWWIEFCKP